MASSRVIVTILASVLWLSLWSGLDAVAAQTTADAFRQGLEVERREAFGPNARGSSRHAATKDGADLGLVRTTQFSLFGGVHVDDSWQYVFREPNDLSWADTRMFGIGVGHDWRRPGARTSFGIEFQAVGQVGGQHHFEFNIPFFFRYHMPPELPVLRSVAFGLGPSFATKPPRYEIDSRGDSQQFMAYWALEAEFSAEGARTSVFSRLHHRSGAFGTISDEGASNVIVLGVRRRW